MNARNAVVVLSFAIFFAVIAITRYGSPGLALSALSGENIVVHPRTVSLVGEPEGVSQVAVQFHNLTGGEIHVVGAQFSCTCVTSSGLPQAIPPLGSREHILTVRSPGVTRAIRAVFLTDVENCRGARVVLQYTADATK